MSRFVYKNRYSVKLADGKMKFYIWRTFRDLEDNTLKSTPMSIELPKAENLLVVSDLCEENGFSDIATFLRELTTPCRPTRRHAKKQKQIQMDGSILEVEN